MNLFPDFDRGAGAGQRLERKERKKERREEAFGCKARDGDWGDLQLCQGFGSWAETGGEADDANTY